MTKDYDKDKDVVDKEKAIKCLGKAKKIDIDNILKKINEFLSSDSEVLKVENINSYQRLLYMKISVPLGLILKHEYRLNYDLLEDRTSDEFYIGNKRYSYCQCYGHCKHCEEFIRVKCYRVHGLSISKKPFEKKDKRILRYYEKNGIKWQKKINGVTKLD